MDEGVTATILTTFTDPKLPYYLIFQDPTKLFLLHDRGRGQERAEQQHPQEPLRQRQLPDGKLLAQVRILAHSVLLN